MFKIEGRGHFCFNKKSMFFKLIRQINTNTISGTSRKDLMRIGEEFYD